MPQTFPDNVSSDAFAARADAIIEAARAFSNAGWTPATSSNFSMRLDHERACITVSGRDKGRLEREDLMLIDMQGRAVSTQARPSAETALHIQVYRRWPEIQVVLHTHSRQQSVASRFYASDGVLRLHGWELQKAITGHTTHEDTLEIPVFPNTQRMPELVAQVDTWIESGKPLHAYLINGHGLYTWGRSMDEARRHLEALECLISCELDLRRLSS